MPVLSACAAQLDRMRRLPRIDYDSVMVKIDEAIAGIDLREGGDSQVFLLSLYDQQDAYRASQTGE